MRISRYAISIAIMLLVSCALNAQVKTVKHSYYTVTYSIPEHMPQLVKYILKKDMVTCKATRVSWKPDPMIAGTDIDKDYPKDCGYDRGHNMPHQNNSCHKDGVAECFYFSNCFPQTARLNRGVWETLEEKERAYALEYGKIKVFIGHIGTKRETLGVDKIKIPAQCWKVIYVDRHFEAYIFPNTDDVRGKPEEFNKPSNLKKIETACNLDFVKLVATLKG